MLSPRWLGLVLLMVVPVLVAEPRQLVVATLEYPPFIVADGDQARGPLVDTVKGVFADIGVRVIVKMYPIARGLAMVKDGEVDAYFSLKKTPAREKDLLFTTVPLIEQPFVFFARSDSGITWNGDLRELSRYRIGVVSMTSYGAVFDGSRRAGVLTQLDEAQSFEQNIKKLIAGRVDLVINSLDVGRAIIREFGAEGRIVALSPAVEVVKSYLAFTRKRDFAALAQDYDRALAQRRGLSPP